MPDSNPSKLPDDHEEALDVMRDELNAKIVATGCWSDYNQQHRQWRYLSDLSRGAPNVAFYTSDDLISEPDVDDYFDNDC